MTSDPSTTTTTPTSGPTSAVSHAVSNTQSFAGVYEFSGGNSSTDAGNPDLAGTDLIFYWSQLEPTKGVIDWSLIDSAMAPWIAAGKKVVLRVSTSGSPDWDPPYSGQGTPSWVLADGTGTVSDDGETLPVYWDPAYLADYQALVTSLGQHYNGNPNIVFVEPGIGMGGETLPETNPSSSGVAAWEAAGYTDALWLSTVEKIASFYQSAFPDTPIYPMVDRTFFDGNSGDIDELMSWFRSISGWGLQDNGLTETQQLGSEWDGPPLAIEERNPTQSSGDNLGADITNGIQSLHARYLLLYQSDIDAPGNQSYLQQAAAEAS